MKISEAIAVLSIMDENTEVELVFPDVIAYDTKDTPPKLEFFSFKQLKSFNATKVHEHLVKEFDKKFLS